jgi:hypothetical protein
MAWRFQQKAVSFESPGSETMIRYLHLSEENSPPIDELDITAILAEPNFINCAKSHVGRMFRVYKDFLSIEAKETTKEHLNQYAKEFLNLISKSFLYVGAFQLIKFFLISLFRISHSRLPSKFQMPHLDKWHKFNILRLPVPNVELFLNRACYIGLALWAANIFLKFNFAIKFFDELILKYQTPKKIAEFLYNYIKTTVDNHSISAMISTFDEESGMPKNIKPVKGWPDKPISH